MNNQFVSIVCGTALILGTSGAVLAADLAVKAPPPVWDWTGFYFGVGGSINAAHFDQSLQGVSGTINVTDLTTQQLVAQGQEGGPFFDFNRNKAGFAPDIQLGYAVPFGGSGWLGGVKFSYKYANVDSKLTAIIPQNGIGTNLNTAPPTTGPITGFVQITPAEVNLKHQLALLATIGRAFGNVTVYAGGGPAMFDVETNFFNAIPFATTPGGSTFAAGAATTLLNDNWVWGGAAQVGTTYAFGRGWFLDLAYTYARSANFTIQNSVTVLNQNATIMISGPGTLNTSEQVTNQSVTLTLNYQFH